MEVGAGFFERLCRFVIVVIKYSYFAYLVGAEGDDLDADAVYWCYFWRVYRRMNYHFFRHAVTFDVVNL